MSFKHRSDNEKRLADQLIGVLNRYGFGIPDGTYLGDPQPEFRNRLKLFSDAVVWDVVWTPPFAVCQVYSKDSMEDCLKYGIRLSCETTEPSRPVWQAFSLKKDLVGLFGAEVMG